MNCGRKATKKTIVLGFVAPTVKPMRTGCPRLTGAASSIASRASARWRMAWMPSQTTYAAPSTLIAVYAVALAATTAPRPIATRTTWATSPIALPTTESSASRRPTVRARPMVKSRLGPGTWMKRIEATRNATHWLDDGMAPVWAAVAGAIVSRLDRHPRAKSLPWPVSLWETHGQGVVQRPARRVGPSPSEVAKGSGSSGAPPP